MLQIVMTMTGGIAGQDVPPFESGTHIATDDYYIERMANGLDELHFSVPLQHPAYRKIQEETKIIETETQQTYTVKTIDVGRQTASIGCQLDLDDWKSTCMLNFNGSMLTAEQTLRKVCPPGWTIRDDLSPEKKRTIKMDGPTPLEVALSVQEWFGCAIRFYVNSKVAWVRYPTTEELSNAYAIDSVNLREVNYKGKSTDLYTRLYPVGKDGMSIGSVNNGLPYVENRKYVNKTICKLWVDERYTDPQSLKEDAQARVDAAAQPVRSWELDVVDLYRLDSNKWESLQMELFDVILLVDKYKDQKYQVQVQQQRIYPYYPERNKIYVSTVAGSVQRSLKQVIKEITDRNSKFYQILNAKEGL